MSWAAEAGAVLAKEIRSEWRTRVAFSSVALFAVGALTLIAFALRRESGAAVGPEVTAGLLWVLLLFTAATGLGRAFVQEEERGTALALRLSARATAVYAGKFAANAVLLLALTAIATPLLLAVLSTPPANPWLLICVLVLGDIGMAAVFTLMSALVAQATAKGGMLAALAFPVLVPLLLVGVHGTKAALGFGAGKGDFWLFAGDLQQLLSYDVVAVTAALMLFDYVWND